MIKTIEEAINLAKNNDNEGFEYLYKETYKYNYYVALKIVKNETVAEDVLQDSYIKAFNSLDTLENVSKFKSWLAQIVSHKALDELKKNNPILFSETETEEGGDILDTFIDDRVEYSPEFSLDKSETSRLVNEILDTLSEEQKICALMYYGQELSVKEIATSLDVSENTVKSRLNYARKNIKEKVLELEKKGTKLYGLIPVIFFAMLLKNEAKAAEFAPKMAYTTSSSLINKTASKGVFGALKTTSAKIIAAVVSVSVITGAAIGVHTLSSPEETGLYIDFNNTKIPYKFVKIEGSDEKYSIAGDNRMYYIADYVYTTADDTDYTDNEIIKLHSIETGEYDNIFIKEYGDTKFLKITDVESSDYYKIYRINDDNSLTNINDILNTEPIISGKIDNHKLYSDILEDSSSWIDVFNYFETDKSKTLYNHYQKNNDEILALIESNKVTNLLPFYSIKTDDNSYIMSTSGLWQSDSDEIAISEYTDYITGKGVDFYVAIVELNNTAYFMFAEDKKGFTNENSYFLNTTDTRKIENTGYRLTFYSDDTMVLFIDNQPVDEYKLTERFTP